MDDKEIRLEIVSQDFPEPLSNQTRQPGPFTAKEVEIARETAYRRGFQQGATAALYALNDGDSYRDVLDWAEKALHYWRYKRHKGRTEYPPLRLNTRR